MIVIVIIIVSVTVIVIVVVIAIFALLRKGTKKVVKKLAAKRVVPV